MSSRPGRSHATLCMIFTRLSKSLYQLSYTSLPGERYPESLLLYLPLYFCNHVLVLIFAKKNCSLHVERYQSIDVREKNINRFLKNLLFCFMQSDFYNIIFVYISEFKYLIQNVFQLLIYTSH